MGLIDNAFAWLGAEHQGRLASENGPYLRNLLTTASLRSRRRCWSFSNILLPLLAIALLEDSATCPRAFVMTG